ncbi:MAG: hypothetical protein FWG00_00155 [Coriobacteriia bacterium]|nr:hypothetical protein [Coriobacteriia bacterium]
MIVSTLAIEYFSLITLCNIKLAVDRLKALAVVGLANLMSFLAPFLFFVFSWLRDVQAGITSSFGQFADKMPCSFVGLGYLVLTLVVEVPLVYFFLKNRVSNKKKLLLVVVLANIATTLLVAVVQHLFLPGTW